MRRIQERQKLGLAPDPFPAVVEFGGKNKRSKNRLGPIIIFMKNGMFPYFQYLVTFAWHRTASLTRKFLLLI